MMIFQVRYGTGGSSIGKTLSFRRVDLPFSFEMINMIASTLCQDSRGENVMVVVFKRCSPLHDYFPFQACFAFFTTLFTKGPLGLLQSFFYFFHIKHIHFHLLLFYQSCFHRLSGRPSLGQSLLQM